MKKVYYALGAIGAAPVLGAYPAANAVAATAHVSGKAVQKAPAFTCGASREASNTRSSHYHAAVYYSGMNCIHFQSFWILGRRTGLTERIRYYSGKGALLHSDYIGGTLGSAYTNWGSYPNFNATKTCQAIVPNSNHNKVLYGPLCETI